MKITFVIIKYKRAASTNTNYGEKKLKRRLIGFLFIITLNYIINKK